MKGVYYNDNDPKVCAWLRELIKQGHLPDGDVDERPIQEVRGEDVAGYTRCHFFAGIAGWELALQYAHFPADAPVWTGSCPCQPFSVAGKRKGERDERHLWPEFRRLIGERRPPIVFGEQVTGAPGESWMSGVRSDMETFGYAVGIADLPACCIGAPHIRQRFFWVADATGDGPKGQLREAVSQTLVHDAPEALDAWHGLGSPFEHWQKLLAEPATMRVDDGVSSIVDIRPRLHAYGNSIIPGLAAEFVTAFMEAKAEMAA